MDQQFPHQHLQADRQGQGQQEAQGAPPGAFRPLNETAFQDGAKSVADFFNKKSNAHSGVAIQILMEPLDYGINQCMTRSKHIFEAQNCFGAESVEKKKHMEKLCL